MANEFPIFDTPSVTSPLVASSAAGDSLTVALQPMGGASRLVARRITVTLDVPGIDGGLDGGDAGDAADAGSPNDASSTGDDGDGGGAGDAWLAYDGGVLDGASSNDGAVGSQPGTGTDGTGCGCTAAGAADSGAPAGGVFALLGIAALLTRGAVRRRRST